MRHVDIVAHPLQFAGRDNLSDGAFDVINQQLCLFDAGPGRCTHVQLHHAGINGGKEILAHDQEQRQRSNDQQRHRDQRDASGAR